MTGNAEVRHVAGRLAALLGGRGTVWVALCPPLALLVPVVGFAQKPVKTLLGVTTEFAPFGDDGLAGGVARIEVTSPDGDSVGRGVTFCSWRTPRNRSNRLPLEPVKQSSGWR